MQHGPRKAPRSAAPRPRQLLTNEDRDGRRMRSKLHPNTKLNTSSHAQRSVSDALMLDPRHLHRYGSAMVTMPPRSSTPAHCSPAPLWQRLGDSVVNCTCVLRPCSSTAAPGSQRRQLRLRRRAKATAARRAAVHAHYTSSRGRHGVLLRARLRLSPSRLP